MIHTATTYVIEGTISEEEFAAIKNHCINPVDSREAGEEKAKEKENSETDRKENCDRGSDHHTTSNSGYFRNVGNWEKFSFWR